MKIWAQGSPETRLEPQISHALMQRMIQGSRYEYCDRNLQLILYLHGLSAC
jgi:hypothetical protein